MSIKFDEDETPWTMGEKQSPSFGPKEFGNKHPVLFTVIFVAVVVLCAYFGGGKGLWF